MNHLSVVDDDEAPRSTLEDAERAVLGSIFLAPDNFTDIAGTLADSDFLDPRHGCVWRAFVALDRAGQPIDLLTVINTIPPTDLAFLGGPGYVTELDAAVPISGNVAKYASIVREASVRRTLRRAGLVLAGEASNLDVAVSDVIGNVSRVLLAAEGRGLPEDTRFSKILHALWHVLEKRHESGGAVTGVPTGLRAVDDHTLGFQAGDLVLVGARAGMGKSSMAFQVAAHAAISGFPALVCSLEMSAQQVGERILFAHAGVDSMSARRGQFGPHDWPKMARSASILGGDALTVAPKLHVAYTGGRGVDHIRALARRVARAEGGLGLLVVDYVQLVKVREGLDNRAEGIAEISRALKILAGEIGCAVVCAAQLNRDLEKRADKRPILSDLKDSGSLEADADTVIFLYRDDYYDKASKDAGVAEVIVAKQRNGPTGVVRVRFEKEYTRFSDLPGT